MSNYTRNYQDFPFSVECYDHLPHVKAMTDIPFWVEYAKKSGGPVLELGCGTGRVLIPVAREGIDITGVDISPLMQDRCRDKLAADTGEVRDRVTLVESSMHDFSLGKEFALVFLAFRSFQILQTVEEQLACLNRARAHLKDDGRLIIDVFDPYLPYLIDESRKEEYGEERFDMPDGRVVTFSCRNPITDLAKQTIDCELIYYISHPDGREERLVQAFRLRFLYRYELEHLLARAGFQVEDVFSDFDRSPFGAKSPGEIIMVARKA
jgi:SAM-dependent methyltransferase